MRDPVYKSRPIEPNAARLGGERINEFIVLCEAFSNCYLLETAQGNIQINAGMAFEAPVIRDNFSNFSTAPLRYLILTQGHVDHVGGVGYWREQHPGLEVIAQADNPAHQAYDRRLAEFRANRSAFAFSARIQRVFAYYTEQGYSDFPQQDEPTPDILFTDRYSLALGGLELELIAVPGAETDDSLIVWLPQHKICLTGNLFGCPFGHFPNLSTIRGDRYRDALNCAAAVQTVLDLGADTILYGHHGPVAGRALIAAELTALRDAIHYVHDATVQGMNAGKDVYTLMRDIALPTELAVGQGYGKVSWGVRAIWEHYAGWFHHRSTTELYAAPASDIHADLVELAGSSALLQRATEKLAAGETPAALHLLDIVLGALPDALPGASSSAISNREATLREALTVSLAAHRKLAHESENFWLSAWLDHQIEALATRLK